MDKLVLRLTYNERIKLKRPLVARSKKFEYLDYFEACVEIAGEEFTSYVNQFSFFYEGQMLDGEYTINYDLKSLLDGEIFDAKIIEKGIDNPLPPNIILAFEYALIKYYLRYNKKKENYFHQANTTKINLLFFEGMKLNNNSDEIIKYKISRNSELRKVINDLNELAGKNKKIRLDGNRNLSSSVLESIFYNLLPSTIEAIEYIEEPFNDIHTWRLFNWSDRIKMAVDESFQFERRQELPEEINHVILKFGVNISIFEYFTLRREKTPWKMTITSGFECPKLFNLIIHLASLEQNAAGLSTFNFFENALKLYKRYDEESCSLTAFPL